MRSTTQVCIPILTLWALPNFFFSLFCCIFSHFTMQESSCIQIWFQLVHFTLHWHMASRRISSVHTKNFLEEIIHYLCIATSVESFPIEVFTKWKTFNNLKLKHISKIVSKPTRFTAHFNKQIDVLRKQFESNCWWNLLLHFTIYSEYETHFHLKMFVFFLSLKYVCPSWKV